MATATLFSNFLTCLGVPHTAEYSDKQFRTMPFQSAFGLTKLLAGYGVDNAGYRLSDKSELTKLTPPFLADTPAGFVIVTGLDQNSVSYLTQGEPERIDRTEFEKVWNGIVILAFPTEKSIEPDYASHRTMEIISQAKRWMLIAGATALFAYLFVSNGIWRHLSTVLLCVFDMLGLWLTYMLVQKTLKIKNHAADRVCGVLEEGGCDSVLELKASSFFGIFKWSEVGFTYFSVSLLALLMFPQWIRCLALCNLLCLPFTLWSIWYQKFRAKVWCTLCVSVQATLWLLFFCYLGGGWIRSLFPLRIEFFVLGVTYLTVLLALNRILPKFDTSKENDYDQTKTDSATRA